MTPPHRPLRPTDLPILSIPQTTATQHIARWLSPTGGNLDNLLNQTLHTLADDLHTAMSWRFTRVQHKQNLNELNPGAALTLRAWINDTEILILLELRLALIWLDLHFERFSDEDRALRPLSPMEEGLLMAITAHAAATLHQQGGPNLRIDALPTRPAAIAARLSEDKHGLLSIEGSLTIHTTQGWIWIVAPTSPALRDLQNTPTNPEKLTLWCTKHPSATTTLTLELARLTLPQSTLSQLEPGALLVADAIATPAIQLRTPDHTLWSCALEGDITTDHQLRITTYHRQEAAMDPTNLDQVPVEVTLELANITLPLADLAALRTGQILPLHQPLHQPVTLRAGQQVLGQGELVTLDGQLALRITSVTSFSRDT